MPPLIDITFDGHVHTRLCHHAVGEMEDYVKQAVERGLRAICFLEHLETDIAYHPPCWLDDEAFVYYFSEGERLKRRYRDRIEIQLGMEMGFNPQALRPSDSGSRFPVNGSGFPDTFTSMKSSISTCSASDGRAWTGWPSWGPMLVNTYFAP
jgi:hypothetical protein